MSKSPKFDDPKMFGATSTALPIPEPESIQITKGAVVQLRYKGKALSVRVTNVVRSQAEFEGSIEAFEDEPAFANLSQGDQVRFTYDKIEHIHQWDQNAQ